MGREHGTPGLARGSSTRQGPLSSRCADARLCTPLLCMPLLPRPRFPATLPSLHTPAAPPTQLPAALRPPAPPPALPTAIRTLALSRRNDDRSSCPGFSTNFMTLPASQEGCWRRHSAGARGSGSGNLPHAPTICIAVTTNTTARAASSTHRKMGAPGPGPWCVRPCRPRGASRLSHRRSWRGGRPQAWRSPCCRRLGGEESPGKIGVTLLLMAG